MFKIENFNINLERKNAIFHNNETIIGSLDFTIKREMYARSIRLKVEGYSAYQLIESKGNSGLKVTEGFEPYLNFFVNFLPVDSQTPILLNPGDYCYKFEIKLPETIPSSVIHRTLGETAYCLSATIDVPWSTNKTIRKPFYVLIIENLNSLANEEFRKAKCVQSDKIYGVLCCKRPPLKMTLTTQDLRSSYIPSEQIRFQVDLINLSHRKLTSMRVELIRKVYYNLEANEKKKREYMRSLAKVDYKFDADPGKRFTWPDGALTVPDYVMPTHDNLKLFIQINYELKLTVFSTFFTTRATLVLPIRIGNVKIRDENNDVDGITPCYDVSTMDEDFLNKIIKFV